MSVLDRKLARDLRSMAGQLVAILAVVACGVSAYVAMMANHATLTASQAHFYEAYAFADVFAPLTRAPEPVAAQLRAIPAVSRVDTRVVAQVRVEVADFAEPIVANVRSIDETTQLNRVHLVEGRMPGAAALPGGGTEALVNAAFARAHDLALGDTIGAVMNGRWQRVRVVGTAISPEFVFNIVPGSPAPDDARFATLWIPRPRVAAAFDFDGAFNEVSLQLARGADERAVLERVDAVLEPYGGRGAYGRDRQASHRTVSQELEQLESFGLVVPAIFLGVAAFLLNVVLSRLIQTQREQIAVLKALGYGTAAIAGHYGRLVTLVVVVGVSAGVGLGAWLGGAMAQLYRAFFAFPALEYTLDVRQVAVAVGLTAGAAAIGTWRAVAAAVALPPAEAMRPQAPPVYRQGLMESTGLAWILGPVGRMSARNLLRRPLRAVLTSVGIAFSVAILVVGTFSADAIDYLLQVGYGLAQREEVTVTFTSALDQEALEELERLPAVHYVEGTRTVPVRIRAGHRVQETAVVGLPYDADLRQLIDADLRARPVPAGGLMISRYTAERFHVGLGDTVRVQVLDGDRRHLDLEVVDVIEEMFGTSAYMEIGAVNRAMGEGPLVTGALIEADPTRLDSLYGELMELPHVATVSRKDAALKSFLETNAEIQRINRLILVIFASTIAVGVVYNSARIAFQERSRELASLRVMGFTKAEVTGVLLGELAAIMFAALPLGWLLGWGMAYGVLSTLDQELYRFPMVINARTYAFAAVVVMAAGVAAALLVRRGVDRLDMIAVLKTRD